MAAAALLALLEASEVVKKGVAVVETKLDTDIKPFHCNLAPCYGTLKDGGALKGMDDELKIMIAGTTNEMGKLVEAAQKAGQPLSWDAIVAEMHSNYLLEPMDNLIQRSNKLIKKEMNYFKFDGSPSRAVIEEVHSWFVTLINDEDVLRDTLIDIDTTGALVAQTGARVEDFGTLVYKHTVQESEVMDIGIMRYPDIDNPYFKVYRIQLTAWADCTRILFAQEDANGITGVFTCRKYKPRASVIARLPEDTKKKAVEEAESYFP